MVAKLWCEESLHQGPTGWSPTTQLSPPSFERDTWWTKRHSCSCCVWTDGASYAWEQPISDLKNSFLSRWMEQQKAHLSHPSLPTYLQKKALTLAPSSPTMWLRYIEDTFVLWPHAWPHTTRRVSLPLKCATCIPKSNSLERKRKTTRLAPGCAYDRRRKMKSSRHWCSYRKSTHTDRYIYFTSDNHPRVKMKPSNAWLGEWKRSVTRRIRKKGDNPHQKYLFVEWISKVVGLTDPRHHTPRGQWTPTTKTAPPPINHQASISTPHTGHVGETPDSVQEDQHTNHFQVPGNANRYKGWWNLRLKIKNRRRKR